jgi:hypothetical protein
VEHPGLFIAGIVLLALGILLTVGFMVFLLRVLRPSLKEDSPLWLLGCAAPFAIGGGVIMSLIGFWWTAVSFSDNVGR